MRQAEIYRKEILAGTLTEDGGESRFCYDETYLTREEAQPVSLTLPLQAEAPCYSHSLMDSYPKTRT